MGKRNIQLHFRVTSEEADRIHQKMNEVGVRSLAAYLRKMALDGYCINLDLKPIRTLVSLLRICSNNLNQYAKKAHETGNIYETDIQDLQIRLDEIWKDMKKLLVSLSGIR